MTAPLKPQIKQPAEALSAVFAFATLPMAAVLVSATVAIAAKGLVAAVVPLAEEAHSVEPDAVRVRLIGGTESERYLVTVAALDDAGDRHESEQEVLVTDLTWVTPDGTTPYLSLAAFVTRFGFERTVRLTEELTPGRIDKDRLAAAILDAQGVVDGYLAAKTAVPLALPVPRTIATMVYDLALARLYADEAPAGVASNAKNAMQQLRDLAQGKQALPPELAVVPASVSSAPVLTEGPERLFSRRSMEGF